MAWLERPERRTLTSKTFTDDQTGQHKRIQILGTHLHFDDGASPDLQPVDMGPVRVNNAQLDGWRITQAGWHYAIGRPGDRSGDGWFAFGGRRGAHWIQYRLLKAGYLHWPPRDFTQIGPDAAYDRANLRAETDRLELEGTAVTAMSRARWTDVFPDVHLELLVEGRQLKNNVIVTQAARDSLPAPDTPDDETYFAFVYQLDLDDIPKWVKRGLVLDMSQEQTDEDGGEFELRDAQNRLLAFMPLDYAYVATTDVDGNPDLARVRLRKRFYTDDSGNHYLLVGARVDRLKTLPRGDITFDPTITYQPGSEGKDAYSDSRNASTNYGGDNTLKAAETVVADGNIYIEFDISDIAAAATCDSATLSLYRTQGSGTQNLSVYSLHSSRSGWTESGITWNTYDGTNSWTTAGGESAGSDYETGALGTITVGSSSQFYSTSLTASRVEGWFGTSNTNYGLILMPDSASKTYAASDNPFATNRPRLEVQYTEAGSGVTVNASQLATAVTVQSPAVSAAVNVAVSASRLTAAAVLQAPSVTARESIELAQPSLDITLTVHPVTAGAAANITVSAARQTVSLDLPSPPGIFTTWNVTRGTVRQTALVTPQTLAVTTGVQAEPARLSTALTLRAPTIRTGARLSTARQALAITLHAPAVSAQRHNTTTPTRPAAAVTLHTPAITLGVGLEPARLAVTVAPHTAAPGVGRSPARQQLAVTPYAAAVTVSVLAEAARQAVTLTLPAPTTAADAHVTAVSRPALLLQIRNISLAVSGPIAFSRSVQAGYAGTPGGAGSVPVGRAGLLRAAPVDTGHMGTAVMPGAPTAARLILAEQASAAWVGRTGTAEQPATPQAAASGARLARPPKAGFNG